MNDEKRSGDSIDATIGDVSDGSQVAVGKGITQTQTRPVVTAEDRVQLQQVVLNLMMNGMDAMAGTASRTKELLISSGTENSTQIVVRVEDGGVGFSPAITEKIFEPFFTTKPQGIGMGLSISRSIVESHQGRLWATPRPSGGAIFQFTIPIRSQDSNG